MKAGDVAVMPRGGLSLQRECFGAIAGKRQMLDGELREKLQRERPLVFVKNIAVGRLSERAFGFFEGCLHAGAIFFDRGFKERRLVHDDERLGSEIEENSGAMLERNFTKFPTGIKPRRSGVVRASRCGGDGLMREDFRAAKKLGERQEHSAFDRIGGTLRIGIECANGFDGVAKKLDANGLRALRAKKCR